MTLISNADNCDEAWINKPIREHIYSAERSYSIKSGVHRRLCSLLSVSTGPTGVHKETHQSPSEPAAQSCKIPSTARQSRPHPAVYPRFMAAWQTLPVLRHRNQLTTPNINKITSHNESGYLWPPPARAESPLSAASITHADAAKCIMLRTDTNERLYLEESVQTVEAYSRT